MLKELYQELRQDAASREAKVIRDLAGVDARKVFVWENGTLKSYNIEPPLRSHEVERLADLKTAVEQWADIDGAALWIDHHKALLSICDADRRDTVRMNLDVTPECAALERYCGAWLTQDDLIGLLRRELRFLHASDVFLASVRKIRWAASDQGQSVVDHGKESLGRQVEKSVAGLESGFPDELTCSARVYVGVDSEPYPFTLTVDVNLTDRKFRLTVLPGQMDEASRLAREFIASHFNGTKGLTVLLGSM